MLVKSKLTANDEERAAFRTLSKSEQRGEADRARAVLLTPEGDAPGRLPRPSSCTSARCGTGGVISPMAR